MNAVQAAENDAAWVAVQMQEKAALDEEEAAAREAYETWKADEEQQAADLNALRDVEDWERAQVEYARLRLESMDELALPWYLDLEDEIPPMVFRTPPTGLAKLALKSRMASVAAWEKRKTGKDASPGAKTGARGKVRASRGGGEGQAGDATARGSVKSAARRAARKAKKAAHREERAAADREERAATRSKANGR
jgi:hypothetical protein